MQELVSIIITTYGGKAAVLNAVESCLNQSYSHIEVIVVDDSGLGTDGQKKTVDLLYQYIDGNKILYIPHDVNKNASVARNTGIRASKGKYIAFLDDDDIFCNKKIENQVKAFEKLSDDYGVVYCTLKDILEDGSIELHPADQNGFVLYDFLMMKVSVCTSNIMVKKEYVDKLDGFDESFIRHQDWEFLARLAAICKFSGISYIGTIKHSKYVVKRFKAQQAEAFRIHYWKTIDNLMPLLTPREQGLVRSHECNEVAKLYFREKKFKKAMHYIIHSRRPQGFIIPLLLKPIKYIRSQLYKYNGRVKIVHGW